MNYIKQLTGFFEMASKDHRLNATHISLYMALFQFWNLNRFKNPISISRNDLMEISKISGKATYHKVIKELHNFQYIRYEPSYNSYRGSLVYLFNFKYCEMYRKQVENRTGNDPPLDQQETAVEQLQEPSLNNINFRNSLNNLNLNKKNKKKESSKIEQVEFSDEGKIKEKEEKSCAKKEEKEKEIQERIWKTQHKESSLIQGKLSQIIPPSLEAVQEFFKSEIYPEGEAVKFFHYFSSNGWLVGGKTPMKNWQAAAHSWMLYTTELKTREIHKRNHQPKLYPGHLHSENDRNKDYSEPL